MHEDLWSVIFSPEHVVAELFWNGIFFAGGFVVSRFRAYKKIHKYIDDKHGVKHEKDEY
jgi:hypothetical protein